MREAASSFYICDVFGRGGKFYAASRIEAVGDFTVFRDVKLGLLRGKG